MRDEVRDCDLCKNSALSPMSDVCRTCGIAMLNFEKRSLTNADRIRAMSDEELAEYHADNCGCPHDPIVFGCRMATIGCIGCWLDWLREESET